MSAVGEGSEATRGCGTDVGRVPAAPGDRLLLGSLVVMAVGTPTVFLRTSFSTFDIPQLTLLWLTSLAVLIVGAYRVAVTGVVWRGPRSLAVASGAFLAALALSTALSEQPWVAFTGLTVRGAGALTYAACVLVLHAVYGLCRRRSAEPLVYALVAAHGLVVLYALMQAYGLDPFTWGVEGQGPLWGTGVFSTLGNPNFSAGFLGLTLPLLVWVAFGSALAGPAKAVAGAGVGASVVALAHLGAFQGYMAALVAGAVALHWAFVRTRRGRLAAVLISLPVVGTVVGVPLALDSPGATCLIGTMAVVVCCAVAGAAWDTRSPVESLVTKTGSRQLRRRVVALAVGMAGLSAVVFRSRILEQVESGLDQRTAFWKTALSIFSSSPVFGTGLETYLSHFASHRPVEHAVKFERVISDSPHSVPLGMFSGGGLLLGLSYASLALVVGYLGVRAVVGSGGHRRLMYGAVLASWLAYHIQSSVSMDMPGLIYTQWILGGILVAGGAREPGRWRRLPWVSRDGGRRNVTVGVQRRLLAGSVLTLLFSVLAVPLTSAVRADIIVHRAQQAISRGDLAAGAEELVRAIELQPRNGFYSEGLALVYAGSGLPDLAFLESNRAAGLQPGNPYAALAAAEAAIKVNRLDVAHQWYQWAAIYEPNGAEVLSEAARFLAATGQPNLAYELLDHFEELRSPNRLAWVTAKEAYLDLGDRVRAGHAGLCATVGQEGC